MKAVEQLRNFFDLGSELEAPSGGRRRKKHHGVHIEHIAESMKVALGELETNRIIKIINELVEDETYDFESFRKLVNRILDTDLHEGI